MRKKFVFPGLAALCLLLSLAESSVFAQNDWHLKKEEDGIKVYTRNTPNSNFKTIKVEFNMNGRLSQVAAFLLDVNMQEKWIYNSRGTKLITRPASNEIIFYSEIELPWPCANRDYVSHVWMNQASPQVLSIVARAEPELEPVKSGKVRVKISNASWEITAVGGSLLKVVYIVQFDPGGVLPAWLVNMFIAKAPIETFKNLRDQVNKPEYVNAKVDFIKE